MQRMENAAAQPSLLQPPRRVMLLANAKSRSGDANAAENALVAAGLSVVRIAPQKRSDITAYIVAHAAEADAIVAAGGDGTMNAVIDGVIATGLPLGVMPMGTANDLARTLDLPLDDLKACASVIARGLRRRIDVGDVNGETFFNVASIGLSAELAMELTPERKKRFGKLAYAITALKVLSRARPFSATIRTKDGEQRVKTMQIAVGNGLYYGGGNAVEENATIDDGHLDLYSLEFSDVWKLALMALDFRAGKHGMWQEVRTEKCVAFEIITRKPRPVNADGEILTHTPATFSIRPKALEVFVSAESAVA